MKKNLKLTLVTLIAFGISASSLFAGTGPKRNVNIVENTISTGSTYSKSQSTNSKSSSPTWAVQNINVNAPAEEQPDIVWDFRQQRFIPNYKKINALKSSPESTLQKPATQTVKTPIPTWAVQNINANAPADEQPDIVWDFRQQRFIPNYKKINALKSSSESTQQKPKIQTGETPSLTWAVQNINVNAPADEQPDLVWDFRQQRFIPNFKKQKL